MAETLSDLQSLQGVLLGLGLRELPKVMQALHQAQNAGRNVREGRGPKDDGPPRQEQAGGQGYDVQSMLLPLLAQRQGAGGPPGGPPGGQAMPMPQNTPGVRPGMPPAPLPPMAGVPRTMRVGASPAGW